MSSAAEQFKQDFPDVNQAKAIIKRIGGIWADLEDGGTLSWSFYDNGYSRRGLVAPPRYGGNEYITYYDKQGNVSGSEVQ